MIVFVVLSAATLQPSDVFEQPHAAGPRKIEFRISAPDVAAAVEGSRPAQPEDDEGKGNPPSHNFCCQLCWLVLLDWAFLLSHDSFQADASETEDREIFSFE